MFGFLKQVFAQYGKDKVGQMSAAFAYIAVFSIGPLLLVLVSIVGFIYGEKAAAGQLYDQLAGAVGPDTAKTLQDLVANTGQTGKGIAALVFGIVGLSLGAIGLTAQLQNSYDTILRVVPDAKAGIKFTVYTKFKNIIVVIVAGLVAVASVVLSALINGLGKGVALEIINTAASWLVFVIILYLIYRILPDVRIPRFLALKTAVAVSLLFLVGKLILGFVIGRNGTAGAYGAAASLVVLLLWFYYTAQILMLGAEAIKVYEERHGVDFLPKRYSARLKKDNAPAKKDLRGRLQESFSRGYKGGSQKK